jgi:hypothetical protein
MCAQDSPATVRRVLGYAADHWPRKNMAINAMLASEDATKAILASENYLWQTAAIRVNHLESGDCRTFTGHRG